jgi:hypothetical protein
MDLYMAGSFLLLTEKMLMDDGKHEQLVTTAW